MVSKSDVFHAKGTNRLLAAIEATPQEAMMRELVERTKNRVGESADVSLEFVVRWTGTFRRFAETLYTCRIIASGVHIVSGKASVDPVEACRSALQAWAEDRIAAQREQQIAAENRAAAVIETSDFLTGEIFTDNGEATTGTLPLISNGPSGIGGEYQREVRP